jgi:chemotaxis protein methyltransferase CheR
MKDRIFQQYASYVAQNFGIHLTPAKKILLETRLYKLISTNDTNDFSNEEEFYEYLLRDQSGRAKKMLADAITTNHTFFMRETEHFACFKETALPYWAGRLRDGDLRTWCAACSTGEEAYTLAMILQDFSAASRRHWDKTLLATDLSEEVLVKARMGVYEDESVKSLPQHWQSSYFQKYGTVQMRVIESLRHQVLYRRFNLMSPLFPFKRPFHVIFCRNVMIYFDAPTRRTLVRKFYDFLEPGGFLFIGHSEVIDRQMAPFVNLMPAVYQRM